jgi:ParB family chromosome partitioning protein
MSDYKENLHVNDEIDTPYNNRHTLTYVNIDELASDYNQSRKHFDDSRINDLKFSIEKYGIFQPIAISEINGQKTIKSGERRVRAAKEAGYTEVPAIYIEDEKEISIIENVQRDDLNVIEEAEAILQFYRSLHDKHKKETKKNLASILGKSKQTITEMTKIGDMPDEIKAMFRDQPRATKRRLKKIATKKNKDEQKVAAEHYLNVLKGVSKDNKSKAKQFRSKIRTLKKDLKSGISSNISNSESSEEIIKDLKELRNALNDEISKFDMSNSEMTSEQTQ